MHRSFIRHVKIFCDIVECRDDHSRYHQRVEGERGYDDRCSPLERLRPVLRMGWVVFDIPCDLRMLAAKQVRTRLAFLPGSALPRVLCHCGRGLRDANPEVQALFRYQEALSRLTRSLHSPQINLDSGNTKKASARALTSICDFVTCRDGCCCLRLSDHVA